MEAPRSATALFGTAVLIAAATCLTTVTTAQDDGSHQSEPTITIRNALNLVGGPGVNGGVRPVALEPVNHGMHLFGIPPRPVRD